MRREERERGRLLLLRRQGRVWGDQVGAPAGGAEFAVEMAFLTAWRRLMGRSPVGGKRAGSSPSARWAGTPHPAPRPKHCRGRAARAGAPVVEQPLNITFAGWRGGEAAWCARTTPPSAITGGCALRWHSLSVPAQREKQCAKGKGQVVRSVVAHMQAIVFALTCRVVDLACFFWC